MRNVDHMVTCSGLRTHFSRMYLPFLLLGSGLEGQARAAAATLPSPDARSAFPHTAFF